MTTSLASAGAPRCNLAWNTPLQIEKLRAQRPLLSRRESAHRFHSAFASPAAPLDLAWTSALPVGVQKLLRGCFPLSLSISSASERPYNAPPSLGARASFTSSPPQSGPAPGKRLLYLFEPPSRKLNLPTALHRGRSRPALPPSAQYHGWKVWRGTPYAVHNKPTVGRESVALRELVTVCSMSAQQRSGSGA